MGASPLLSCLVFKLCAMLLLTGFTIAAPATGKLGVVAGTAECLDCMQKNIKLEDAIKGLNVAVKCKEGNWKYETKAAAEVENRGSFNLEVPSELLREDGELKDECLLQLHDASNKPCPSELVLKPIEINGRRMFSSAFKKLSFSSGTCASAFYSRHFHKPWHRFPPYISAHKPHYFPWHKPWHKFPPYTSSHKPYFRPLFQNQKPTYKPSHVVPPPPKHERPLPVDKEPTPLAHQQPPFYHAHPNLFVFYEETLPPNPELSPFDHSLLNYELSSPWSMEGSPFPPAPTKSPKEADAHPKLSAFPEEPLPPNGQLPPFDHSLPKYELNSPWSMEGSPFPPTPTKPPKEADALSGTSVRKEPILLTHQLPPFYNIEWSHFPKLSAFPKEPLPPNPQLHPFGHSGPKYELSSPRSFPPALTKFPKKADAFSGTSVHPNP